MNARPRLGLLLFVTTLATLPGCVTAVDATAPARPARDANAGGNADKKKEAPRPAPGRWELQKSGVEDNLNAVTFADEKRGWAVGDANTILATDDGGKTWRRQTRRDPDVYPFVTVRFTSPKVGWASAEYLKRILHTTDGGQTWKVVPVPVTDPVAAGFCKTAAAGGAYFYQWANYVYRTDDGGKSWKTVTTRFPGAALDWGGLWFADASHGCATWAGKHFAVTKDGGKTWKAGTLGDKVSKQNRSRTQWADAKTGWILPQYGKIHVTRDGGGTWLPQETGHGPAYPLVDLHFADARLGHVLVLGKNVTGEVRRTADGGANWHLLGKLRNPSYVRGISFPTRRHGWVVGDRGYVEHYHEPDAR